MILLDSEQMIKATSTRLRFCLKTQLFFLRFQKISRPHEAFSSVHTMTINRFQNATLIDTTGKNTAGPGFEEKLTTSFSKSCVFICPHDYGCTAFSKISTLESVFEKLRFRRRFHRFRVGDSPIRNKKGAFSNENAIVWTIPRYLSLPQNSTDIICYVVAREARLIFENIL